MKKKQNSTTNQKTQTRGTHHQSFMVYESKTENHRLIFTAGSTTVLTFDPCMHQRAHTSAGTVQTEVHHATSSVNNADISPSFVNSLHGDASHPYMAAPFYGERKKNNDIQEKNRRKEPKSFDVVMNSEVYNYCSNNKPRYWPRNAQLFLFYLLFSK